MTARRKAPPAADASAGLAITIPASANDAAEIQAEAVRELAGLRAAPLVVASAEDAAEVGEFARDWARKQDAVKAMRESATRPLQDGLNTVRGWFKPVEKAIAEIRELADGALGAYALACEEQAREAKSRAQAAAEQRDAGGMLTALVEAKDAAPAKVEGVSVRYAWRVRRVIDEMVTDFWKCPDIARINAHAAAANPDEEIDPIPGVVFERVAITAVRR